MSKSSDSKAGSANPSAETKDKSSPSLYQRFLAVREEVLRYKWLKSEEAGEDIGFEPALVGWLETQEKTQAQ